MESGTHAQSAIIRRQTKAIFQDTKIQYIKEFDINALCVLTWQLTKEILRDTKELCMNTNVKNVD